MTITLSDVRYSYQGKYQTTYAVNGVSGSFESGRLYAIVGKSGSAKQAKETASRMREKVGLPETYERRLPGQLSGGEQQRVAIARALAQGSRVLLADEPTGNLDTENTRNIVETLKRLAHEEDCCVIIVTHDPAVAEQADVVLRMSDGKWVGNGENS